jgi:hypothetical protein
VNGFAVMTSTPSPRRLFQVLSFCGLPGRVPMTTTESVTMPSHLFSSRGSDDARVDEANHVGRERELHDVGGEAGGHRAALLTGGASCPFLRITLLLQ